MTCREFWSRMPELDGNHDDHTRECSRCAEAMERQHMLAIGLRQLAREQPQEAPPRLEARVLAAFRRQSGGSIPTPALKGSSAGNWWARPCKWTAAAAAAVALILVGDLAPRPAHIPRTASAVALAESDTLMASDAGFIPLPYAGENVAVEEADLVHVRVPRSTLIALGVPVNEATEEAVEAEVLLGIGGAPQAVRILQ